MSNTKTCGIPTERFHKPVKAVHQSIQESDDAGQRPTALHAQRRDVHFHDLSQVMPDVRRLRPRHRTVGRWSLGQICAHLAAGFHGSIDGFDLRQHRLKRWFFAKALLWYTFRYGIPENYMVDPGLNPPAVVDTDEGIEELARAIERYRSHRGRLRPHPLFGRMRRQTWARIQCIHCAHHLSFVVEADALNERT